MADDADEIGAVDWFGNPLRKAARPVPCPSCGEPFTERDAFESHLADVHAVRHRPPRSFDRARRWRSTLGHLPLWLVLPLDVLLVLVVVGVLWPVNPWYAAYAGGLATLPLVLILSARTTHH